MEEQILLVIENVQSKPPKSLVVKNCDLLVTDRRIVSFARGISSVTASMLGNVIAGPFGSVWAAAKSDEYSEEARQQMSSESLDEMIASNPECLSLFHEEVTDGYFKTGFLVSLGLWSPFQVKTKNEKFFFNVPYKKRKLLAAALREINSKIKVK